MRKFLNSLFIITFIVKEKSELPATADKLLQIAGKRRKFVLYGDLGAGKTTLVQSLCAVLGVRDTVASPTFSLVNEYRCTDPADQSVQPVYHLDLYRLKDLDEALAKIDREVRRVESAGDLGRLLLRRYRRRQ